MKAYACFCKNTEIRKISSSGGVYFMLAQQVIQSHGIVYAVCYDENFETVHREIKTERELIPSLGSKYIPSHLGDTFEKIRVNLLSGKLVLFVGTPCQCVGLQKYLAKNYNNLICVDFVCHGVPSRAAWRKYLSEINADKSLVTLNMRDKSSGWSKYQYSWKFQYKGREAKTISQSKISFMKGFSADIYLRPSCYECRFKGIDRSTDITLGDYWGVWNLQTDMDDNKGTSLVLIHSDKGRQIFEAIRDNTIWKEAPISEVIRYNPSITESAKLTEKREKFFNALKERKNFDNIINQLLKDTLINKVKRKGKMIINKIKKKQIYFKERY